jgi:hypothetical protein
VSGRVWELEKEKGLVLEKEKGLVSGWVYQDLDLDLDLASE